MVNISQVQLLRVYKPFSIQQREKRLSKRNELLMDYKTKLDQQKDKNKTVLYKRAAEYYSKYAKEEQDSHNAKIEALKTGDFYVEKQPKLLLLIRTKGINKLAPKPRKILQLFRLTQLHNAVFIRNNKATKNMLQFIEPYVTYGEPTLQTIRKLIYKRGFCKVNKQRLPIMSNEIIESELKSSGVICVEDLINEIYTVGPMFKKCNAFLWPFKLNTPKKGYKGKKSIHFVEGGECGNREKFINELADRMI